MRIFHTQQQALDTLGPQDDGQHVGVGWQGCHNVYTFSWNDRTEHGVLNFQYLYTPQRMFEP